MTQHQQHHKQKKLFTLCGLPKQRLISDVTLIRMGSLSTLLAPLENHVSSALSTGPDL